MVDRRIRKMIEFKYQPLFKVVIEVENYYSSNLFSINISNKTKRLLESIGIFCKVEKNSFFTTISDNVNIKEKVESLQFDDIQLNCELINSQVFNAIDLPVKPFIVRLEEKNTIEIDTNYQNTIGEDYYGIGCILISKETLIKILENRKKIEYRILTKAKEIPCRYVVPNLESEEYIIQYRQDKIYSIKKSNYCVFVLKSNVKATPFQFIGNELKLYQKTNKRELIKNKLKSPSSLDLRINDKGDPYWEVYI